MSTEEVQLNLDGPHGAIDPKALADAINALDKIVRNIEVGVPAEPTVAGLSIGSAQVSIHVDRQRVEALSNGLALLAFSSVIPESWNRASVQGLVDLEHVENRRGVEGIQLCVDRMVTKIDAKLAAHARESIAPPAPSLGSVRGTLFRYNGAPQRRDAGLRDRVTGRVVEVHFSKERAADIRGALELDVEIWGEVRRDLHDRVESVNVVGIEILDSSRERVTLDDVAGILGSGWTDGLDTAEWVSRQRD